MSLKFGTDGVRAEALTVLTTDYVAALGRAAAQVLGGGRWLIGRDTRESGAALEAAVVAGLAAGGAEPVSLGVVPTPALAWMAQQQGCPAAMITASHNPWRDNGVKIFAPGGSKLPDAVERAIEAVLDPAHIGAFVGHEVQAAHEAAGDAYVKHLVGLTDRLDGLTVVLDCANGAMSEVAPAAFRALGAHVTVIHDQPDGRNINDHCGATHTESLSAAVVAAGASMGLAFDGDGDRVIAVDHLGRTVDGDRLIALAALLLREEGRLRHDTVVVTVMSNLGFHKAMAAAGIDVVTTAVGDRYVLEALDAGGFSVGGEQSGHIIYRDLATTGDGLLAGLRLAQFVHGHHDSLAHLAAEVMTSYPQVLVNVKVAQRHPHVAAELADEIAAAEDGLQGDGRILVRASGTEPLIRVMVEAATDVLARTVADDLAAVVLARFG
ncbi:MAG: phosphoglucosamine mutase [Actinomycetota bacterium]|nr:phosphoglucosamine mutase [Actinomycetota bacterium]